MYLMKVRNFCTHFESCEAFHNKADVSPILSVIAMQFIPLEDDGCSVRQAVNNRTLPSVCYTVFIPALTQP